MVGAGLPLLSLPERNSVGQGVTSVAVVGVGLLWAEVVLALLEGSHSCPGGVFMGRGGGEDTDELVSMGVFHTGEGWGQCS